MSEFQVVSTNATDKTQMLQFISRIIDTEMKVRWKIF